MCDGAIRLLVAFNNYVEWAAYSSSGADGFTVSTPVAFFSSNNRYYVTKQNQGITEAHADTQTTAITLVLVY